MAVEATLPPVPDVDIAGVDRSQIRQFLRLSLPERLAWLDDCTTSLRELRKLNPQLSNPQLSNPQLSNPQLSNPQLSQP